MRRSLIVVFFLLPFHAQAARVPCAAGDWPVWRGTPQHTGCQGVAGRINHPVAKRLYRLGGLIQDQQFLVAPAVPGCGEGVLLMAPAGALAARCASGRELWSRQYAPDANLWGIVDLDDDGRPEFLATSNQNGTMFLQVFDVVTGEPRWSAHSADSGIGDVAIGDIDGDGEPDLVWMPASTSTVAAYTFKGGYPGATLLWQTRFVRYVSDPYTPSSVVLDEASPGKSGDVVVSGGRHEFSVIVLDGATGNVMAQQDYLQNMPEHVTEGGGEGQLAAVCDVNGDHISDIVVVGGYQSSAGYMFQGALTADPASLDKAVIVDAHPYGWEFVDGSLRESDGQRHAHIIVSRFSSSTARFGTSIVDLNTLGDVASVFDARLRAIVNTDQGPVAVVQSGNVDESGRSDLPLRAYRIGGSSFEPLDWTLPGGAVITTRRSGTRAANLSNPGVGAITVDPENNGVGQILVSLSAGDINAVDLQTGLVRAHYQPEVPVRFVRPIGSGSARGVIVALFGGDIVVLDSALRERARTAVGGFYRNDDVNGHANAPAIVADLDGDNGNRIYVNDAVGEVVRIDARDGSSSVVFKGHGSPDAVAIEGSLIVRGCTQDPWTMCRYDAAGSLLWQMDLPDEDPMAPIGANVGRFGPRAEPGIVVAAPPQYPKTTYSITATGHILWSADGGPFWDATYAVADFDGDGVDDVVFNYDSAKAHVISGVDGHLLSGPVTLPVYRQLDQVDYNGAPMVLNIGPNGSPDVIDVEDDGHVARLRPMINSGDPRSEIVWSVEQAALDDERTQMPAAADTGSRVILGCGSKRGVFTARDAANGSTLWQKTLIPSDSAIGTSLTKSVAGDVNGDGSVDFIVGGEDGELHALDAATGRELWSVDIGSAVGEPIMADVDGDGYSEIIVAASDGWLYEVTERARKRAVSH